MSQLTSNLGSTVNQKVLQNPFHPLDLSAQDLLIIYKRFDISSQANRNPQQQLPIQTVAQIIASIKGCRPSYIQKCISQALIKDTLSWKDFLAFLDQQSQVRHKIMEWLLHEKAIIKYRFENEEPFRQKICKYFDEINHLNYVSLGSDELLCAIVDLKKMILIDTTDGVFKQIDSFIKFDESTKQLIDKIEKKWVQTEQKSQKNMSLVKKQRSQIRKSYGVQKNKNKTIMTNDKTKSYIDNSTPMLASSYNRINDQTYFKKQRKNIHSVFNLFAELPLEESQRVAELASDRIRNRNISTSCVSALKQKYGAFDSQKKIQMYAKQKQSNQQKPLQKAAMKLNKMYKQKQNLSYNPYMTVRTSNIRSDIEIGNPQSKKLGYERKQKQYQMQISRIKFCKQLNCYAVMYFNMKVSLVRVMRQYNKIILNEQDARKIEVQKDFKKNEIVQGIQFYKHRITNKWFLVVLFRIQYKNQSRSRSGSVLKGYQINPYSKNKNNNFYSYKFQVPQQNFYEDFTINLGSNEIMQILSQPQFGIHAITHNGKYIITQQDYVEKKDTIVYWKIQNQEKFKGVNMSLTCMSISLSSNKILFGTIKGILIVYDLFSHHYKLRKICYDSIIKIHTNKDHAYILTSKQKVIIFDIIRNEQIQIINVRNEQRLHQKVTNFEIIKDKIVCFGTCIRVFEQIIDESMQHQKIKMQNMYTWRLNKINNKANQQTQKSIKRPNMNSEHVLTSNNFIIVLTQIQQAIFFSVKDLTVKFTIILDIPHDAKVMKIAFSQDEKLLGVLLFDQNIYIFNVYTQELFMHLPFNPISKYTTLSFLDKKNEYFVATGTQSGKIYLNTFPNSYQKSAKFLDLHKKALTCTVLRKNQLFTTSQDFKIGVWQLPFNFLKYEFDLKKLKYNDIMTDCIGYYSENISYFKSLSGNIYEVDTKQGTVIKKKFKIGDGTISVVDLCNGFLVNVDRDSNITFCQKSDKNEGWETKKKVKIQGMNQIIGLGVVPSQKIVIFSAQQFSIWSYNSQKQGKVRDLLESING